MKLNKNDLLQRLQELSPRERVLSVATLIIIVFYALYLLIVAPIATDKVLLEQKIKAQQQAFQYLKKISVEVTELRKSQQSSPLEQEGQSLMSVVDASSAQLQIKPAIKRVIPEGVDNVTVWLENANFDQLSVWLVALETKHGIKVSQISITREPVNKGQVSAKIVLSN
jgi:general secretion pathway protein M